MQDFLEFLHNFLIFDEEQAKIEEDIPVGTLKIVRKNEGVTAMMVEWRNKIA